MARGKTARRGGKGKGRGKTAKRSRSRTTKGRGKTTKRTRKTKRVSKVARGRLAKAMVFRGSKAKTVGGLTKK